MKNVKAIVFDAYGTLLDVHGPSAQLADRIGPAFACLLYTSPSPRDS